MTHSNRGRYRAGPGEPGPYSNAIPSTSLPRKLVTRHLVAEPPLLISVRDGQDMYSHPTVTIVNAGSPLNGLVFVGDRITHINGMAIFNISDVTKQLKKGFDNKITVSSVIGMKDNPGEEKQDQSAYPVDSTVTSTNTNTNTNTKDTRANNSNTGTRESDSDLMMETSSAEHKVNSTSSGTVAVAVAVAQSSDHHLEENASANANAGGLFTRHLFAAPPLNIVVVNGKGGCVTV
eukprot:CAMPEP_0194107504 /NCGR_PEP_ID=MMETSP0150-20130528/7376_1 /TAXON_ID=122233 /ORGANISM="Chaetoceros debilis, Strain MM31A-1" /LENGTH=233 /DNA_ID=CAMNT_0038795931 /DNA_START=1 /DNA_END=698 /DNA_ORIENTATION=-